ncbi:MAG: hypothetical protein WC683_19915 [bacterium]
MSDETRQLLADALEELERIASRQSSIYSSTHYCILCGFATPVSSALGHEPGCTIVRLREALQVDSEEASDDQS